MKSVLPESELQRAFGGKEEDPVTPFAGTLPSRACLHHVPTHNPFPLTSYFGGWYIVWFFSTGSIQTPDDASSSSSLL